MRTIEACLRLTELYQQMEAFQETYFSEKTQTVDSDDIGQAIYDIYSDYCDIEGSDSRDECAEILYELYENIEQYCDPDDNDTVQDSHWFQELISKFESAQQLINDEIPLDDPDVVATLSTQSGRLRQWIADDFEAFADEDEAETKFWQRALTVERKFYDIARNSNPQVSALAEQHLLSRRLSTGSLIINTHHHSGRTLITADAHAVSRSTAALDLAQLDSAEDLARQTGWHKRRGKNWNMERLRRGSIQVSQQPRDVVIHSQYQPSLGQLGNFFMRGIGRYGDEKNNDILAVINRLTGGNAKEERVLAQLLINFSSDGIGFTPELLTTAGFDLPRYATPKKSLIEQLNRFATLFCFKEVARRKYQGYYTNTDGTRESVPELPFGLAKALLLILLRDGSLRMAQVFASDAEYGVFTGTAIMHPSNIARTKSKFLALLDLFIEEYLPDTVQKAMFEAENSFGKYLPSPECLHKALLRVDGGAEDSAGEEYSSEDEDTRTVFYRFERLSLSNQR